LVIAFVKIYYIISGKSKQWENEVEVPKRDGQTSSRKRIEEYRINEPSHLFKKKKKISGKIQ
jgi:hypothetical protein